MLTKDEIEQELAKSEYSDQIRKSLSNYYEGLDENVAVAIDFRNADRDMSPENVQSVVSLLREQGIDAVSFLDKEAAMPDKYVITESGVLCPNMKPKDALKATVYIEDLLLKNDYHLLGHANPQTAKSLLYTSSRAIGIEADEALSANTFNNKAIDIKEAHPNIDEFNRIEAKHGGDYKSFIDEMVADAYAKSEIVDFNEMSVKNVYADGGKYLYRGGSLGNNPYATISEYNSRKVAHSSPALEVSGSFSGKGETKSTKGGAFYPPTSDNIQYGFIYEYESMGDEQIYYRNVGLEEGYKPRVLSDTNKDWNWFRGQIYETPVLPHHNKVHAIYLHVGKEGENKLYSIPLDENGNIADEKWRDFFAMHEPSDDKVVGYVADRQDKIKNSPDVAYEFKTGEKLPPKNYTDLSAVPTDEFLKAFVHRDALTNNGGQISCKESLGLDFLGVEKIPSLSNVTINGRLFANQVKNANMADLPFASNGYFLVNATVENCDKVDAETFCRKLGMEYKNEAWDISNNLTSGKFVGCPQNFANTPIKSLNFIDLTVDNLNEIPVTKDGANSIKVKNQEAIKDMSPDLFIRKIIGDNYDKFPDGKTLNPNYKLGLNLSNTNIVEFPKGLDNYQIEKIIFPEKAVVKSLDNVPITQKGCYGLKYSGDLSKETTESFLLKTKGKDWCAEHLAKAADGHLIVNGDVDFNTEDYSPDEKSNLDITSFPKDIERVEFKGKVEPLELKNSLGYYLDLQSQKNNELIYIKNNKEFNYDLSDFRAKDVNVLHNFKSIKLSEEVKNISFQDIDDLKLSSVNLSNKVKGITLFNVKSSENLDLSKQSDINLYDCKLNSVNLPDKVYDIFIKNTDLNENIKLPAQANNIVLTNANFGKGCKLEPSNCEFFNLSDCKFPEGSTIDLSKCKQVTLSNVDLSKLNIKLPEQGRIYINENVKFAPDYKLDFSMCQDAIVHPSTECSDIKLPTKGEASFEHSGKLHKNVKEVTAEYVCNHQLAVPEGVKIIDAPMENGKKVSLERLARAGVSKEQIADLRKERLLKPFKDVYNKLTGKKQTPQPAANENTSELKETLKQQAEGKRVDNGSANLDEVKVEEPKAKTLGNEDSSKLHETLKEQTEAANQTKNASAQTPSANGDLHSSLKNQKANSGQGGRISAVSNRIDDALEKIGNKVNDNAVGRTIGKIDSWRPNNKIAAKAVDKVGVVPVAAVVASGVSAYEQYKSGDKKGAAATMVKGTTHAVVQGVATSGGMNLAAKGVAKGTEKVVTKVVERNLTKKAVEKVASKAIVKAGAKAAGKAAGKAILKKVPFVSLAAGAYFAYERAKNGEWGKAGCEILSGAAGCVPFVGTIASTAIDCGLAVADTKQAINETKKQQAAEQTKKEQTQKPQQNKVSAQRLAELRNTKPGQSQKKPAPAKKQQQKPIEKGVWDKFTDLFSR